MNHNATAVRFCNVGKSFQDRGIQAIGRANLAVKEGEFVSIVGLSGCGKSTILFLASGIADPGPLAGKITVFGKTPNEARKEKSTSIVMQQHALLPNKRVFENVRLPLQIHGLRDYNHRIRELLELVGLSREYWGYYPRELSGGMKQRVAIARALVTRPKLLLMDEPFGALDDITRTNLIFALQEIWLAQENITVLFVTHNIEEAIILSDRVLVMKSNRSEADNTITSFAPIKIDIKRPRTKDTKGAEKFQQIRSRIDEVFCQ